MVAASSILSLIDFALRDVELRVNRNPFLADGLKKHKMKLRNLKAFVVCSRELSYLESLMKRIAEAVKRYANEIHRLCDASTAIVFMGRLRIIFDEILCLEEEMDEYWRIFTVSDYKRESVALTADEIVQIADSIIWNLADFPAIPCCRSVLPPIWNLATAMEALGTQMTLLKNFLLFVVENGAENGHLKALLNHFGAVSIDAASVFSKCPADELDDKWCQEMMVKCSTFLQNIKPIDPRICRIYIEALGSLKLSSPPTQNCKKFLDFLISDLWDLLQQGAGHLVSTMDQRQLVYEGLRFLRTLLNHNSENVDENMRERIKVLICDAGGLILSCHQMHAEDNHGLQDLLERINIIQSEVEKKFPQPAVFSPNELSVADSFLGNLTHEPHDVVGFREYEISIMDQLFGGAKNLRGVLICGMPGVGKTTLASAVYNHPSVLKHFHVRAWCSVSSVMDSRGLLIQLSKQIVPENFQMPTDGSESEIISSHLRRKRYLIVLDGVWTAETWHLLEKAFPDDSVGSRILVTSRHYNVVPINFSNKYPLILYPLDEIESLELLKRKVLHRKDYPPALHEILMSIVKYCNGLPLTIVRVAGLLSNSEHESWKEILDGLNTGAIANPGMSTWESSYEQLPDDLKHCFLYFGAFPKHQDVSVKRLIHLWIAEGFIQKHEKKRKEDVAEEYLMELIIRNFAVVAEKRSKGGIKSCRLHDFLHDFCLRKVEEENFFHLLHGQDNFSIFNEPCYLQRLCIPYDEGGFQDSRSLPIFSSQKKLLFQQYWLSTSFINPVFRLLKVLHIEQIHLGIVIPSVIGLLSHLRYLSIRGKIEVIPSWIDNLLNLEIFVLRLEKVSLPVTLPRSFWNLQNLKCTVINLGGGILPIENLEDSPILYELESFSCAVIACGVSMEKQLRKFPNIRRLKCDLAQRFVKKMQESDDIVVDLEFLSQLHSLHLLRSDLATMNKVVFDLCLPWSLKKLTLSRLGLPWKKISPISKLPNLEVFKLLDSCFSGNTWYVEEGDFQRLRFLKLSRLDIVALKAEKDSFGCLETLVLDHCSCLERIPDCLGQIPTLEKIDVFNCRDNLKLSVRFILMVQRAYAGNNLLEISIR